MRNMIKNQRLAIGKLGEDIARKYLEDKGLKIIDQNYRTKYGEIDLVGKAQNELVFIEVRTKTGEDFGTPEETINRKKIAKLERNAISYTNKIGWKGAFRLDALCLVLDEKNQPTRIDHYQNIC